LTKFVVKLQIYLLNRKAKE